MIIAEPVRIDRVQAGDYPAWTSLWRDYLSFYRSERPESLFRRNFDALLADQDQQFGRVARLADGRLIGLTHAMLHQSFWSEQPNCYLQDLFVAPDCRGRGVARALIEATAEIARARGAGKLYWQTHIDNSGARRLYEQLASFDGFIVYEREI